MNKILLHCCCGPCATYTVNRLRDEGFEVTTFWYNPNIHPFTEHRSRLEAMRTLAQNLEIPLIVAEGYDNKTDGWKSAGIGIAVGEVFTWSQPWNGTSDLEDYESEFNEERAPITWKLTPTASGLQLLARF